MMHLALHLLHLAPYHHVAAHHAICVLGRRGHRSGCFGWPSTLTKAQSRLVVTL